jgi:hypothetical protein
MRAISANSGRTNSALDFLMAIPEVCRGRSPLISFRSIVLLASSIGGVWQREDDNS